MKRFILILTAVLAVLILASCASVTQNGTAYSNAGGLVNMTIRGEATNTVWLGMFGDGTYPLAETVARDNGITRLATVEHYWKLGVFGLWTDYTTVVTGE